MNRTVRTTALFVPLCALGVAAAAQSPFITESTGTPPPAPRPRVRPRPTLPAPTVPPLLWKTLIRRCDGSPALVGDIAYVVAGGQVQQIDAGGRTLWATDLGPSASTPVLDDTRVYVGTNRGVVYGINRKTGQVMWKWTGGATDAIVSPPAVGAGRVYVESSDNNVYGLAAVSGGRIWTFTRPDGSLGYSGPVFLHGDDPALAAASPAKTDALFVCGDTTIYRLDPATGKETWHTFVGGKSLATPAIGGGRVFVGGDHSGLSAFSAGNGKPLWNFTGADPNDWFGTPVYAPDGAVYVSTESGRVYAVDAVTGKPRWSFRGPSNAAAAPAAPVLDSRGRTLFVASTTFKNNPTLTALDTRTGAKRWETPVGDVSGSPVVSVTGDRLYVAGTTNGYLYCFGLR